MKARLSSIFLIILVSGFVANAAGKKQFTGKITFKITVDADLPEQAKAMMPKTMTLYVGDTKTKTELFTGMGMQSSIEDLENKTKVSLLEMGPQKFAIKDTWEEIQKELGESPELEIEYTGETQEIAGYSCEKVLAKSKEGGEIQATAWVTSDINVPEGMNFSNPAFGDVNKMMLKFEVDAGNGIKLSFTAIEVEAKKIKDKVFEIPEGFKEVTKDELQNMFGG